MNFGVAHELRDFNSAALACGGVADDGLYRSLKVRLPEAATAGYPYLFIIRFVPVASGITQGDL